MAATLSIATKQRVDCDSDVETCPNSDMSFGSWAQSSGQERPPCCSEVPGRAGGRETHREEDRRLHSAPAELQDPKERRNKDELHAIGECTPCYFFVYKGDGCRNGDDCQFCHRCTKADLQKRKKEKHRKLRAAMASEGLASSAPSTPMMAPPGLGMMRPPPGLTLDPEPSPAAKAEAPAAARVPVPGAAARITAAAAAAAAAAPAAAPAAKVPTAARAAHVASSSSPSLYDAFGKPSSSSGVYDAFGKRVNDSSPVKIAVDALAAFSMPGTLDDWDEEPAGPRTAAARTAFGYTLSF